jgi:DNA-binding transcriptional LysR family regulator
MENQLYFMGGKQFKLDDNTMSNKIFEELPLIYREEGSATRNEMEQFIMKNKLPVNKKIELTSNEAVKQAVISGLGYSIMPLIGVKNELRNKDLQIIPVSGLPINTTWRLIWLKRKKLSPAATAYLEYLNGKKEKIIKDNFSWIKGY